MEIKIVKAFTKDKTKGNPAGVILNANNLTDKQMNKNKFVIEQGYVMKKAGKIFVEISDTVKVGGYAVIYGKRNIEV